MSLQNEDLTVNDIDSLGCNEIPLFYSGLEFVFKSADLETTALCSGLRKAYAFFYYKNGKRISRKSIHIPRFKPCANGLVKGCVKWDLINDKYVALKYNGKTFKPTKYSLSLDYFIIERKITIRDLKGKPFCYTVENNERIGINAFSSDTYVSVSYIGKRESRKNHDFYLECHCNEIYEIQKYETAKDLLYSIIDKINNCSDCIDKYIDQNIGYFLLDQLGYRCGTNFFIKTMNIPSQCFYGHLFGQKLKRELCV